jgi:hypothetical protein
MGASAEKLGELIPSSYYDLVARVIPGIATIIGILWGVQYPLASVKSTTGLGDGALLLAGLGCGYIAGLLLTTVAAPIFAGPAWLLGKYCGTVRRYSHTLLWARIDKIDRKNPKAGATLAKMAAEVTLCQNLFTGSLIMLCVSTRRVSVLWVTTILILLALTVVHRVVILVRRLDSLEQ